jgi:hypothetical protein
MNVGPVARRVLAATAQAPLLLACRAAEPLPPPPPPTLDRPADPLVLTGADLPWDRTLSPAALSAWRYDGSWTQVAVQVDERVTRNFEAVYGGQLAGDATGLLYADPDTWTGADDDPALDADDELVLRGADVGSLAPIAAGTPPGTLGAGLQLHVRDPVDGTDGHLYLFEHDGTLDPAAGLRDVTYSFRPLDEHGAPGDYKAVYEFSQGTAFGPRRFPEHSTIETAHYRRHWSWRNTADSLDLLDGSGVNLVERHDFWREPGDCVRHIGTFDAGRGAFIANRQGPIRAIRSYLGANSAPLAQTDVFYYAAREDTVQYVRAHARDTGGIWYTDHSSAAVGMRWSSNLLPEGALIDGQPDEVPEGPLTWAMVQGEPGTTFVAFTLDAGFPLPEGAWTRWYADESPSLLPPCATCTEGCEAPTPIGDTSLYGAFGPWLRADMPNTDPRRGEDVPHLVLTAVRYVGGPRIGPGRAEQWDQAARNPLSATLTPWPPP